MASRLGVILVVIALLGGSFAYVGGWLDPQRLTPARIANSFEQANGRYPGFRRAHAKGVCVLGLFVSTGAAAEFSSAGVFAPGRRTPVLGRFSTPGGNPYAPDGSVPIRSLALRFTQLDGQQWRTAMNSMPVFPVATPQAFYEQLQASEPVAATGKPDPERMKAFFAGHPETAAFLQWVKSAKPSASFATEAYNGLNAFFLVDDAGERHTVRWGLVPEETVQPGDQPAPADPDFLAQDLAQRLAHAPLRWHLTLILAKPGDPTNDATKQWPADRTVVDAGTLLLQGTEPQDSGPCRDINYDPLVLPTGILPSDDPLLAARSAVYATSYERRTSEEAGVSAAGRTTSPAAKEPRS